MDKGILGPLDALLDFGEVTLSGSSVLKFPNVIDLNTSNADTLEAVASVETDAAGGTSVQLVMQGSDNNSTWHDISAGTDTAIAKVKKGDILRVGIPRNNGYRYLQLTAKQTGSMSAGKLHAWLDVYPGK